MKFNAPRSNLNNRKRNKRMTKLFCISPGHGKNTPGKRSPDGSLLEWEFNRRLVNRISELAEAEGIPHVILDYEDNDTPLSNRCTRANKYGKNCCYISIHGNAAGNGSKWMTARGWCIYTSKGYTKADPIASIFVQEADKLLPGIGCKVRKYKQKQYEEDFEENFYVLRNTIMPAVLTENLFYDNKLDKAVMQSDKGIDTLAKIHVNAMKRILAEGL